MAREWQTKKLGQSDRDVEVEPDRHHRAPADEGNVRPRQAAFRAITGSIGVSENGTIRGDFSIDAGSVATGNEKRDKHLRSEDFFDVDRYPQFTYRPRARPAARAPVKRK